MAIKESTHWYDKDGKPCYTVIGKNGNERPTTLRDARKTNLLPSVTSIIGVVAKPGLENWKIDQALMAALTLPKHEDESLDDFMKRAKYDAREQAIKAAQRGTAIHADIEIGYMSGWPSEAYVAVNEALSHHYPDREWIAEDSFASDKGYGGKVDLYSGNVVVDFKTKDNLAGSDPARLVYDEHGMQLSAYADGLGIAAPRRVSIFIDRNDVSVVLVHVWDEKSHEKHLSMFNALLSFWQLSKGYQPQRVTK